MVEILKTDKEPILKTGKLTGSLEQSDYEWGYSEEDKRCFKLYAEKFYQTFKLKYTSGELTPYMVKLVDYGLYFMNTLPCSLGRFQAEGGEHLNYILPTYNTAWRQVSPRFNTSLVQPHVEKYFL